MFLPSIIALSALIFSIQAYEFPDGQLQPGCYSPPALPHDFSAKLEYWRSKSSWVDSRSWKASRQSTKAWSGWAGVKYLFTLLVSGTSRWGVSLTRRFSGDSYTSTQFDVHGEQPNPGNPLGNPAYPGVTSCDGPNYVDFLTTTYNQSYIQTFNFGFGGATVDPSLVPSPFGDIVQSFKQQVQQEFIPTYDDKVAVPWSPANSLVTLFFGINDMVLSHSQQNDSLNYALIKSYESIVHQLYDAGIRNFLIMNVPPLDRDPSSLAQTDSFQASLARYIGLFNFRLEYLAINLAANFPETTVFQLNTNQLFTLTLNNPKSFAETSGYTNTTGVCPVYQSGTPTLDFFDPSCGVPINEYLWMNNLHPTYPMHNLMASQIVQLLGD